MFWTTNFTDINLSFKFFKSLHRLVYINQHVSRLKILENLGSRSTYILYMENSKNLSCIFIVKITQSLKGKESLYLTFFLDFQQMYT